MINFKNTYSNLPSSFYADVLPAKFLNPQLIAFNHELAQELKMNLVHVDNNELVQIFSGQKILAGSRPIAMAYAGFQFGHPVPSLGDGRAILLGEVNGRDIQLKGAGQTPFSRNGDGRSALGPVIREYIVSEAMHSLGIPTTRALAAVASGETLERHEERTPGGVFTRVAESHIRVGTFQYFYFREDFQSLETLLNYTIERHYPEISLQAPIETRCLELLKAFAKRQGDLIAKWTSVGFIHGVMNTDNCSLAGITIDYGPCAFMDHFKRHKVFSSIDRNGRYSFFNQLPIIQWNILRLADCLLPLMGQSQSHAVELIKEHLYPILQRFEGIRMSYLARKLGIDNYQPSDDRIVDSFLDYLEENALDYTLSFRNLRQLHAGEKKFYVHNHKLENFLELWKERVSNVDHLDQINPLYIPRNHQVQVAIDEINRGVSQHFERLTQVLRNPFGEQVGAAEFSQPPKPDQMVHKTFCGT